MIAVFMDKDGETIFEPTVEVLPRVGELVYYNFSDIAEKDKYSNEALKDRESLNHKTWRVISITHEFREYRPSSQVQLCFVELEELHEIERE